MITIIVLSAILAILGIVILAGKGDMLIAGYNTASQEEREQYDVKRLRLLLGVLMLVLAVLCLLFLGEHSMASTLTFSALVFVLSMVVVVLANTWAKKKSK